MKSRKKLCSLNDDATNMSRERPDKLSNLPEPILHHILSFLDMKFVVQTSLLSRRWRYLWVSLPFLNFNHDVYLKCLKSVKPNRRSKHFLHFVNRFLFLRDNSTIQRFSLILEDDDCDSSHVDSWIRVAILRNVKELHLQFCTRTGIFVFPHCLFTSKSLTSLTLISGSGDLFLTHVMKLPVVVNLPALKILHCKSIDFSLDKLLLGSPALNALTLVHCSFGESQIVNISSPQLKQLEIRGSWGTDFKISGPRLVKFHWKEQMRTKCSIGNQSTLEIVNLDIDISFVYSSPAFRDVDGNRMIKCLKGLYNVKHLKLSAALLEAISQLPSELENWAIPFSNLRYLCVETWLTVGCFQSIMFLLEKSLNVETLVLCVSTDLVHVHVRNKVEQGQVLKLNNLKFVEFRGVIGCLDELQYLKILLNNAVTLKKVAIIRATWERFAIYKKRLPCFTKEVLTLPRASSDVTISFS